jgi:SAM-dependent methyltransferase
VSGAFFKSLARDAASRYPARDRFARHFAYGKLTGDPVFEYLLSRGLIRDGVPLLDLGCGQGLLASLLDAARERHARADWPPDWPAPARPSHVRGIDMLGRDIERARAAWPPGEWIQGDIRNAPLGEAGTIVVLDVLHYLEKGDQDTVLGRMREALASGGVALVRVADGNGSLRFRTTIFLDQLMCIVRRQPLARLHTRPLTAWLETLRSLRFDPEPVPMSEGTPFANVLVRARAR